MKAGRSAGNSLEQLQTSIREELPAELRSFVGMFYEAQIAQILAELEG